MKLLSKLSMVVMALAMTFAFSSCDSGNEDLFDCPELGLNFGDECESTFPDRPDTYTGSVSEDCECLMEGTTDADCPELGLNIGDECGEVDGNPIYVDENCECAGEVGASLALTEFSVKIWAEFSSLY